MASKILCKACNSINATVIESRICNNGTRRRRYSCLSCKRRWTHWDGPRPTQGRMAGSLSISSKRNRQTTEEEVRKILLAPLSITNAQLSRQIDFSPEWIRRIRIGLSCVNLCPELARHKPAPDGAKGRSCYNCLHWTRGCDFDFPDSYDSPGYAQDCDLFKLRKLQTF